MLLVAQVSPMENENAWGRDLQSPTGGARQPEARLSSCAIAQAAVPRRKRKKARRRQPAGDREGWSMRYSVLRNDGILTIERPNLVRSIIQRQKSIPVRPSTKPVKPGMASAWIIAGSSPTSR